MKVLKKILNWLLETFTVLLFLLYIALAVFFIFISCLFYPTIAKKEGVKDLNDKIILPVQYDNVWFSQNDDLFICFNHRFYGVVDSHNNVIIPFNNGPISSLPDNVFGIYKNDTYRDYKNNLEANFCKLNDLKMDDYPIYNKLIKLVKIEKENGNYVPKEINEDPKDYVKEHYGEDDHIHLETSNNKKIVSNTLIFNIFK
ncbi:MAG: hypothetical protein IJS60_09315 [Abditibacteriota bacterium]|nr:hypothetical protein [Abditibacteriota bacterium]